MIFLEYYSQGESHSDGNAALLAVMLMKYKNEKFYLFCNKNHFECIKRIFITHNINYDRVIFQEIKTFPKKLEYQRLIIDFSLLRKIFEFMKKNNETKLFSTYTTTVFLYFLKLFLFLNPPKSAITTIHSELERLYILKYASGFSGVKRLVTILYCYFFGLFLPLSINLSNYKCLVYGEPIKQNLLKKVPNLKEDSVIAINHPYIISEIENFEPFRNSKLNFGVIGLIDKKKNGVNLLKLFNLLKRQNSHNFKVSLIGHIRNKTTENYLGESLNYDFVESSSEGNEFVSKELRDELEKKVDYNIYTYNTDGYKLTASGAFIDAISFEKPVIAIKNDFFTYYFNKFGNIGYLCDNVENMADIIVKLSKNPPYEDYKNQQSNIKTLKANIDVNYIADNIKLDF